MSSEEKIIKLLKDSEQTRKPIKVKIGNNKALIHVLSFDGMNALGKKGGVFSFYFEENINLN